jgi:hypothetical protein
MAQKLDIADPSETAATATVEVRGVRYTFRELEISDYNKLVKQASHPEADEDGVMQEVTDNTLLMQLMMIKSCESPKLTDATISKMGMRLYRALARVVNELHYGTEPVIQINDDDDSGAASEGTPKGNG